MLTLPEKATVHILCLCSFCIGRNSYACLCVCMSMYVNACDLMLNVSQENCLFLISAGWKSRREDGRYPPDRVAEMDS